MKEVHVFLSCYHQGILSRSIGPRSCKQGLTSKKTNSSTVLGPRRINAGVQPLNKNMGPSFCNERVNTSSGLALLDYSCTHQ